MIVILEAPGDGRSIVIPFLRQANCATCTTCIQIDMPQCHTMSYNVIQCYIQCLESFTCPLQPRRICRDGPVDSFQQSWNLCFRRRPEANGKRWWNIQHTGHHWSPVCFSSCSTYPAVVFELHLWKAFREFIRTLFASLRFHSVFLFILPPAVCDLSTCHRLHLARPVCCLRLSEEEQQQSAWIILDPQLLLACSKNV